MNHTHLTAFHAVAEAGSFIRGAERLMVGQPAVSSHVADLESALKTTLFERLPRGVRLTEAGELLLGFARRIAALEIDAEQALAELRGLSRGTLRIGASTTVGAYFLPKLIGAFSREHPGVQITLDIGNAEQMQRRLLEARLDFGVTEGFVDHPLLSAEPVFHDQLVAVAPTGHPLLRRRSLSAKILADVPLLLREPGSGTRAFVERALSKKKIRPRQTMSIGSTEAIKQAVIAGLGVAILSRLTIARELADGALHLLPLTDLTIERPLLLTRVIERPMSAAAKAFIHSISPGTSM